MVEGNILGLCSSEMEPTCLRNCL